MFDDLRYRYRRMRLLMLYERFIRKEKRLKNTEELQYLLSERSNELDNLDMENDARQSWRLVRQAERLDIERPDHAHEESWQQVPGFGRYLTPAARSNLRKLIDAEKIRRREAKAWWWKNVVIPAITALTGLAGVITGMIAVIHSKK